MYISTSERLFLLSDIQGDVELYAYMYCIHMYMFEISEFLCIDRAGFFLDLETFLALTPIEIYGIFKKSRVLSNKLLAGFL